MTSHTDLATRSEYSAPIQSRQIPLLPGRDPIDDWTGTSDPALRRRVQNRLNQRAYRARRQKPAETHSVDSQGSVQNSHASNHHVSHAHSTHTGTISPSNALSCRFSTTHQLACTFLPPTIHELMRDFERKAAESYLTNSPQTSHLLSLSRVNLLRAAYQNVAAAGMAADWLCADDAISIFSTATPAQADPGAAIPPCLVPTALQRAVPHHPWVDVFPFPGLRDNLIRAGSRLDDDEFCHDVTGFWDTRRSDATFLVWGTPWEPQNWEVTEEFVRKWGWLLVGCSELIVSSNAWRRRRGEKPLSGRVLETT